MWILALRQQHPNRSSNDDYGLPLFIQTNRIFRKKVKIHSTANNELKKLGYNYMQAKKVIDMVAASLILKSYMER